jgi:hypothetical protein
MPEDEGGVVPLFPHLLLQRERGSTVFACCPGNLSPCLAGQPAKLNDYRSARGASRIARNSMVVMLAT